MKNFFNNILCTICARGGSQGVKNKNLKILCGKPLIAHTILQAKKIEIFDKIAVSSDSEEILKTALEYGVDLAIKRPTELATNEAPKIPAIQHAVQTSEKYFNKQYDIVVDLDATSPLRKINDIFAAYQLLIDNNSLNVITAMPARRSPYFNLLEMDKNNIPRLSKSLDEKIVRRQDSPRCYDMNGSVYVWRRDYLIADGALFTDKTSLYIMPEERSIDIDNELDFKIVEMLMSDTEKV